LPGVGWVVHGVEQWCSTRVEPQRWDKFGVAVHDADLPFFGVHEAVMEIADEHQIAQGGAPAIRPMVNMMRLTPLRPIPLS
jgi:hypothetical protein